MIQALKPDAPLGMCCHVIKRRAADHGDKTRAVYRNSQKFMPFYVPPCRKIDQGRYREGYDCEAGKMNHGV